jgi:excinuclease UvrABC ATPase subunit
MMASTLAAHQSEFMARADARVELGKEIKRIRGKCIYLEAMEKIKREIEEETGQGYLQGPADIEAAFTTHETSNW